MYPPHHSFYMAAAPSQSSSQVYANSAKEAAYVGAYEELFASDAGLKAGIISHPLFEQLLAAHVACLRVGTPRDEQHIIDSALANRHHAAAKYLALLSHLQSVSHPAHDEELNQFMVDYILLLQSFKVKILEHLQKEAIEAIYSCQEIEEELFSLTGVSSSFSTMSKKDKTYCNEKLNDEVGLSHLAINAFLPFDIQKVFRDHVKQELKQELKKDYHMKLKEVHEEILRKRRAGKLPENTTHFLKDWWISHNKWPYPTEEDKVQLMAETGLDLKQINNWFINQRKRNWQNCTYPSSSTARNEDTESGVATSSSDYTNVTLSLNCDQETSFPDQL